MEYGIGSLFLRPSCGGRDACWDEAFLIVCLHGMGVHGIGASASLIISVCL
jgi:hypothetical protein